MRVALVRSATRSNWQSCVSITWNLARAYQVAAETKVFAVDGLDPFPAVHAIMSYRPDVVAIIDHGAFQPPFLKAWLEGGGKSSGIPIHLHCFGDFPLSADEWMGLESDLHGLRIRFVAASDASSTLIAKLLREGSGKLSTCPFPIDTAEFRFNPNEGAKLRRALGIASSEFVALYTGRFSLQKNTTLLMQLLGAYASRPGRPIALALAGETDDIGADFLGIEFESGFFRQHFNDTLTQVLGSGDLKIVMLGNLGPSELRSAYNAADVFVSLSMHHDEDYGMSPAESLCSGTPVLLTGWGGFHSFPAYFPQKLRSVAAAVLPVSNQGGNLAVNKDLFFSTLDRWRAKPLSGPVRAAIAETADASLSIRAAGEVLGAELAKEAPIFVGFSKFLHELARLNSVPGRFQSKRFGDARYVELYSPYLISAEIS